ncbi:MAG: putative transport system ATP-binding protein [Thermotogaceae bacterium]|jgi:putative ABC transport system ATP-binding protein|nr:putative transport system ATP-binding protein [Thermotogaceae bacterium]MDN5336999.1 putative transport system ATP-binding protein [Thermotogaceae bacterium]
MNQKVVEFINVKKIYDMGEVKVEALKGISFEILKGDYVIIMGPSGSGKSTLLHIMGCLDRPTSGKVLIDGEDTSKMNDSKLARLRNQKIGFVFQSFNLLSKLTALENVELPMIYAGIEKRKRKKRAIELLEMVGLGDRLNHRPNQLSGGQQQRVAIARALANDPPIILADEPTGNLDTKSGEEILKIFKMLHESGKTIIVVTHDPDMIHEGKTLIKIKDGLIEGVEVLEFV